MLTAWRYRPRNTLVQSLDPRARLLFTGLMIAAFVATWDLRWIAVLFAVTLLQYLLARLTLQETYRFWIFAGSVAIGLTIINALVSPGGAGTPLLFHVGPLRVHQAQAIHALAQLLRVLGISLLVMVIPFTLDPALYGVTFRGLGLPDRLAFAMDLSFRFVPSLGQAFQAAADAQRARGFEMDAGGLNPFRRIRSLAPLVVPVTIGAIVGAEEMVDAMDLRAFGTQPRTWYYSLTWRGRDTILVLFGVGLFVLVLI